MKTEFYKKIVRASAIYDFVITFPFAFPILAVWNIAQIKILHDTFNFSGSIPDFDPIHLLFVNLMGSVILVWSALRIYKPEVIYGLFDGIARILFSSWMLFYLLNYNVTGVVWLLLVPEISWGIVQFYGYLKVKTMNT